MNIGATAAQNIYDYQSTLTSAGRASAVFQVLTQSYSQSSAALGGIDNLAVLAGQANLKPLVTAIYTQGQALQASGGGIQNLQPTQLVGGVDSNSASSLLTQLFGDSATTLQGFGAATSTASYLASAGAEARKAYGSGTLTQLAETQAAETLKGSGSTPEAPTAAQAIQASLAAQLAAINNTFTLLA